MPIRLEMLEKGEKANVAVKGNTPWAMAAAALKQQGGNPSWPLVVRKSDGSYAAATFETILRAGDVPPDTPVENLPGLSPVGTLEMSSMTSEMALVHVRGLKGIQLAVLVDRSKFVGTISQGVKRTSGELPTAKLNQLAGQYTDLAKLGDFLLDEA